MPIISSSSPDRNLSDLVEKVRSEMAGHGVKDDRVAYLSAAIDATSTTIAVDDASQISAGWVEIDLELIRVKSVNIQSNTLTLAPHGRGYRGTLPAEHVSGSEVLLTPTMPRSVVAREINREIASLYPAIPGIDTHEFVFSDPSVYSYELPADVEGVLDVRQKNTLGNWERVRVWETEFGVSATDFASGIIINLGGCITPGNTVQVVYARRPGLLNGLGDAFSASGLPDGMADVVELGAMVRLLPGFDMARLTNLTVSENDIQAQRQVGGGSIVARELKAQYRERLASERVAFTKKYPPRLHRVS